MASTLIPRLLVLSQQIQATEFNAKRFAVVAIVGAILSWVALLLILAVWLIG